MVAGSCWTQNGNCSLKSGATGIICCASKKKYAFKQSHLFVLKKCYEIVKQILITDYQAGVVRRLEARQKSDNKYVSNCLTRSNSLEIYETTAKHLLDELNPAMVRISTFDDNESFLNSEAMYISRPLNTIVPSRGCMILSVMPIHEELKTKMKEFVITDNVGNPVIGEFEMSQVFTSLVSSAVLMPIIEGSKVVGVVGVARDGSSKQTEFSETEVEQIRSTTALMSKFIARVRKESDSDSAVQYISSRTDAKSALSGIIGSLELINSSESDKDSIGKYLSIMDRSVKKLSNYLDPSIK